MPGMYIYEARTFLSLRGHQYVYTKYLSVEIVQSARRDKKISRDASSLRLKRGVSQTPEG